MKKELLIASALVGSVGLAGVAEAASMSFAGNHRVGVAGSDSNATAAAVKREEALYSKFLGEQAFKRLEEETKNSDRWDEELKED